MANIMYIFHGREERSARGRFVMASVYIGSPLGESQVPMTKFECRVHAQSLEAMAYFLSESEVRSIVRNCQEGIETMIRTKSGHAKVES